MTKQAFNQNLAQRLTAALILYALERRVYEPRIVFHEFSNGLPQDDRNQARKLKDKIVQRASNVMPTSDVHYACNVAEEVVVLMKKHKASLRAAYRTVLKKRQPEKDPIYAVTLPLVRELTAAA